MRLKFSILGVIACMFAVGLASCGGGATGQRLSNTSATVTTPIYAGAGQGVPGSGAQCGTATFTNPTAGALTVTIALSGGWTFENVAPGEANIHLHAGLDRPKAPNGSYTFAPGQFKYKFTGTGSSHVCDVNGLPAGDLITSLHCSVVSPPTGGTPAQENGPCGTTTLCLGEGKTRIPAGVVTVTYSNWNVTITFDTTSTAYSLNSTYLYLGTSAPTSLVPGQQPWKHENLGGAETDSYTFPLSQFITGGNGAICGQPNLYIYAHAGVTGGSGNTAIGYNCNGIGNTTPGKNHFSYSLIQVPGCTCDTPEVPGVPGEQETAFAFDLTGEVDTNVAGDEWGWFDNFPNVPANRWGWFMKLMNFS